MDKKNTGLRGFFRQVDLLLLVPALVLVVISLSTLLSINPVFFRQQGVALIIAIVGFFIFSKVDLGILSFSSKFIYVLIIILLILILIFGIEVNNARSWFDIFGTRVQISEIAKPFFLVVLTTYLAQNIKKNIFRFLGFFGLVFPVFYLIARQPDLGTGIVFVATSILLFILAGFPKRYLFFTAIFTIIILPVLFFILRDYQKQRILTFFDITSDPTGASYNAIQSLISIGSGGLFGKGFGQGTQSLLRFLPEQHNDFIFATISEDLGFVGSFVVLCLFSFLLYRIYKVAVFSKSRFEYFLCMGIFGIFFSQILFNVGMNLGLMPIIGVTLPFVSHGGSSLLSSFIALGMVSNIAYENKKKQSMEIA